MGCGSAIVGVAKPPRAIDQNCLQRREKKEELGMQGTKQQLVICHKHMDLTNLLI